MESFFVASFRSWHTIRIIEGGKTVELMPRKRDGFFPKLFQGDLDSGFFGRFFMESNYPPADLKESDGHCEGVNKNRQRNIN